MSKSRTADLTIYATGDNSLRSEKTGKIFANVAPTLNKADIVFGQVEKIISERGSMYFGTTATGTSQTEMITEPETVPCM